MKIVALLCIFYTCVAFSRSIPKSDNPRNMIKNLVTNYDNLSLEGEISNKRRVWPSSHWVNYLGSISYRWSVDQADNFRYKLYTKAQLKELRPFEINSLSPAEKFDIYNGHFNYPTVYRMRKKHSVNENKWHGICHGLAAAAVHHNEPEQSTVTSKDGIDITFHSSDVTGLLSYYYARILKTPSVQVGKRCFKSTDAKIACRGVNAASFHLALANKIGIEGKSFAVDIERFSEVWNHNVYSYKSKFLYEQKLDGTESPKAVKKIRIQTNVLYAGIIIQKPLPVIDTDNEVYFSKGYDYFLELDSENNIVGGDWISHIRPDFFWLKSKGKFLGSWKSLDQIYVPTKE
jgi:hypothetical protein